MPKFWRRMAMEAAKKGHTAESEQRLARGHEARELVVHYDEQNARAFELLGHSEEMQGKQVESTRDFRRAAWLFATNPRAAGRNGKEAFALANKLLQKSGLQDARNLDILAAVYAEGQEYPGPGWPPCRPDWRPSRATRNWRRTSRHLEKYGPTSPSGTTARGRRQERRRLGAWAGIKSVGWVDRRDTKISRKTMVARSLPTHPTGLSAKNIGTASAASEKTFTRGNMFRDKKVVVVMPAYNAARTLKRTYDEVMAQEIVDLVVVVDDASQDETTAIASTLPHTLVHTHPVNSRLRRQPEDLLPAALDAGADIVVMVHPDYQYTPSSSRRWLPWWATGCIACVLGSRILGGFALQGGMPLWKYLANRFLTCAENLLLGVKISEYHTGYRASPAQLLERLPLRRAPTISSSTTRCSPKSSGWARPSPKSVAPPATSRSPPRSTSSGASSTGWVACGPRWGSDWPNGA